MSSDFATSANRDLYRMSSTEMKDLWDQSTHLRATCNLPVASRPTQDFLVAYTADWSSFLTGSFTGVCVDTIETNLLGDSCSGSVRFWWSANHGSHIGYLYSSTCTCTTSDFPSAAAGSTDYFGYYGLETTSHECSASTTSTTEWWLGACVEGGSCASYTFAPT
jgi:hypothetical protein